MWSLRYPRPVHWARDPRIEERISMNFSKMVNVLNLSGLKHLIPFHTFQLKHWMKTIVSQLLKLGITYGLSIIVSALNFSGFVQFQQVSAT